MSVTVIMPVYNTPSDLLDAAVSSVVHQTYKELELLIIDDGSEAECAECCDKFSEDKRVRTIHIKNSGVSAARNIGLDHARGEYVTFIDSDDTMENNAIQMMVEQISGVDFVVAGCRHVQTTPISGSAELKGTIITSTADCIDFLCYMNPPYDHIETNAVWGKLYKKTVIKDLRFDTAMVMAEDFKFNYEYILRSKYGKYLDCVGYNYLVHSESISRSYKPAMMKTIDVLESMRHEYEETKLFDALISRCVNIAFTILMIIPDELKDEQKRIECFINKHRSGVIRNPRTRKKVKIAAISSFLGYGMTRKLFALNRRR